jgi:hypothetical protein
MLDHHSLQDSDMGAKRLYHVTRYASRTNAWPKQHCPTYANVPTGSVTYVPATDHGLRSTLDDDGLGSALGSTLDDDGLRVALNDGSLVTTHAVAIHATAAHAAVANPTATCSGTHQGKSSRNLRQTKLKCL